MMLSPLFQRLVDLDPQLKHCYPGQWIPTEVYQNLANNRLDFALEHQLLQINPPSTQLVQALQSGAKAVVTGQQPVLFGGPLLVWEKARTAIERAKEWSQQGLSCVPVFWIAGDDSDFTESVHLEDVAHKSICPKPETPPKGTMVGQIELSSSLKQNLMDWAQANQWEFPLHLWEGEINVAQAFARILQHWFGDSILIVNGGSPQVRTLAQSLLQRFHLEKDQVNTLLNESIQALQSAGLPTQVAHRQQARVFATDGTKRWRSEELGKDQQWTHDVLSRALVCGSLLPTCEHILGPGEALYFGQIGSLFAWAGQLAPRVWPRSFVRLTHTQAPSWYSLSSELWNEQKQKGPDSWVQSLFPIPTAQIQWSTDWQQTPLAQQSLARRWASMIQKTQGKYARECLRQNPQLAQAIEQTWRQMAQGRPHERVMSYWEIQRDFPTLFEQFKPTSLQVQEVEINAPKI